MKTTKEQIEAIQKIGIEENKKSNSTMTFGKYFGLDLSEIPTSYLQWVLDQEPYSNLEYNINKELVRRNK